MAILHRFVPFGKALDAMSGGTLTMIADGLRLIVQQERPREVAPGDPPKTESEQVTSKPNVPEWPTDDKYPKTPWR